MRPLAAILALSLLVPLVPAALGDADQTSFRLVYARLDDAPGTSAAGVELLNDHFVVTATVTNDGAAGTSWVGMNEFWWDAIYPIANYGGLTTLAAGETRTVEIDVRVENLPDRFHFGNGPTWYCLQVADWQDRCWSRFYGPVPAGSYPEDIPHPFLEPLQYGDGPQE